MGWPQVSIVVEDLFCNLNTLQYILASASLNEAPERVTSQTWAEFDLGKRCKGRLSCSVLSNRNTGMITYQAKEDNRSCRKYSIPAKHDFSQRFDSTYQGWTRNWDSLSNQTFSQHLKCCTNMKGSLFLEEWSKELLLKQNPAFNLALLIKGVCLLISTKACFKAQGKQRNEACGKY